MEGLKPKRIKPFIPTAPRSPVDGGRRGGDLLVQNAALKLVVLEGGGGYRELSNGPSLQFVSVGTLNISNRVSFLISSLSNGCFSLIIFLHRVSRHGKSLLDTPLKEHQNGKNTSP